MRHADGITWRRHTVSEETAFVPENVWLARRFGYVAFDGARFDGARFDGARFDEARPRVMRRLSRVVIRGAIIGLALGSILLVVGVVYVASVDIPPDHVAIQTSYIYDRNDNLIAELSNGENRQSVKLEKVPQVMIDAVLAAEDHRFYEHGGIDPIGVARALYQDLKHPGRPQGGSTITQQYVKNVYVGREASVRRKLREAAIAVKLERRLSKDEILERYLNTIYFGRGAYGVQLAAKSYFAKDVSKISLPEAAYLAALIRGPESTDATRNEEKARFRRTSVLEAMVTTGSITRGQALVAERSPLVGSNGVLARKPKNLAYKVPAAGAEFFVDLVRRDLVARFGEPLVSAGGLRVTTTLDQGLQTRARRAVFTKVLGDPSDPDAAVVTLNHGGEVLVLVGGRDFTKSQVNLAVGPGGGGQGRAAGSTFKPFVAAAMLRRGYSMESAFKAPAVITIDGADVGGTPWKVTNYDQKSYPTMNVNDAMRQSVNTVFAQIVTNSDLGPKSVAEEAVILGVTSPLDAVGSIALGTQNVGPLEMADAYLTFANRGIRTQPRFVLAVKTTDGRKLTVKEAAPRRVMKEAHADIINRMLRVAVDDGTGIAARVAGTPVAGKTGTTNDYNDAWFVGYTPQSTGADTCCAMAVWVGYADGSRRMTNVHQRKVTGGSFPAELFSRILIAAMNGANAGKFTPVLRYPGELLGGARRRIARDAVPAGLSPLPIGTQLPASDSTPTPEDFSTDPATLPSAEPASSAGPTSALTDQPTAATVAPELTPLPPLERGITVPPVSVSSPPVTAVP